MLSVFWVCGPPGVGKSSAGWRVFTGARSMRTAYVDIDQLGLRMPWPPADPDAHRLKHDGLAALVGALSSAGVERVVVSGIVRPEHAADFAAIAPGAVRFVRLRADLRVLTDRWLGRNPHLRDDVPRVREEARHHDRGGFGEDVLDTTTLGRDEVAHRLRALEESWRPEPVAPVAQPHDPSSVAIPGVWLLGARAAGASTAGFEAMLRRSATAPAAFIDLQQFGFLRPEPADAAAVRCAAVAAVATTYRRHGARFLVVVGRPEPVGGVDALRAALSGVELPVGVLRASPAALAARLADRIAGRAVHLAGDDLIGLSPGAARTVLERAIGEDARFAAGPPADFVVDTSSRTVGETAEAILAAAELVKRTVS